MFRLIAYIGPRFTIEWYSDQRGKSVVLEYYNQLPNMRKKKIMKLFELIGHFGKIFNKRKFRFEGDAIYAFKTDPDRFFCFFTDGSRIIITNAFEKKGQKLPKHEKEKAIRLMKEFLDRFTGEYYA